MKFITKQKESWGSRWAFCATWGKKHVCSRIANMATDRESLTPCMMSMSEMELVWEAYPVSIEKSALPANFEVAAVYQSGVAKLWQLPESLIGPKNALDAWLLGHWPLV